MEDLNVQIQKIIALRLSWEQLIPEQKALFNNSEEVYNSLISNFETGATVDAALLEDLVNQMNQDEIDADLKANLTNYTLDQQQLIQRLVNIRREEIRLEQIQKNQEALAQIKPEIDKLDSKQNPRQKIIKIAHQVIGFSNKVAVKKFIAICLTSKPQDLELAKEIALGKNPLYEEISKVVQPATDQDYIQAIQEPDSTKIIDPQTNIIIDTSKLPSPSQVSTSPIIKTTPTTSDLSDRLTTEVEKLKKIEDNPKAQEISHAFKVQITDEQLDQIVHQMDPAILQPITPAGQKAAAIIEQFPNSTLSPQAIKLYSQGLRPETLFLSNTILTPRQSYTLSQQLNRLEQSNLGKEISEPLSTANRAFQTFTNKFSGKLPQRVAKPLNYILHPVQSIKGWFGKQVGKRIGVKIYKAFAKKITNKTARLIAKTLLRQGIKQGANLLIKLGLKGGLQLAAQALNIGIPGLGLIVAAVIEVGSFLLKKTVGVIQNVAQSVFGEKIKARDLLALPVAAAASFAAILAGLGTATVTAASSATSIIAASAVAGVFLYITAFTIAPLISTIAQLEMQPGETYNFIGPTGPIPPGCPSGWPTASGRITQGSKTTSTHYSVEAIDIGVGFGTPIFATHPGRAIAVGSSGPYGNYVDVYGVCQGVSYITRYAHMPSVPFYGEKLVNKGDQIGVVNSTGNSTGNHLHYEIRASALGDINQFLPKPITSGCIEYIQCLVNIP